MSANFQSGLTIWSNTTAKSKRVRWAREDSNLQPDRYERWPHFRLPCFIGISVEVDAIRSAPKRSNLGRNWGGSLASCVSIRRTAEESSAAALICARNARRFFCTSTSGPSWSHVATSA